MEAGKGLNGIEFPLHKPHKFKNRYFPALLLIKTETIMEKFRFGDKVKIDDGREAVVQEDQEDGSSDVKLMIEDDDFAHILSAEKLEKIEDD